MIQPYSALQNLADLRQTQSGTDCKVREAGLNGRAQESGDRGKGGGGRPFKEYNQTGHIPWQKRFGSCKRHCPRPRPTCTPRALSALSSAALYARRAPLPTMPKLHRANMVGRREGGRERREEGRKGMEGMKGRGGFGEGAADTSRGSSEAHASPTREPQPSSTPPPCLPWVYDELARAGGGASVFVG